MDLDNNEYVTIYLLPEVQVHSEVNVTVNFIINSTTTRIISFVNYFKTITKSNFLVSALNTNVVIFITDSEDKYISCPSPTAYCTDIIDDPLYRGCQLCGNTNPISAAGFFSNANYSHYTYHTDWSIPESNSTLVNGFYGGCTPFEALLHSTLDCLYDIECLDLLIDYFPALNQVYMI
jgi:hypothetical protein